MSPVNIEQEVDEVWLAMQTSYAAHARNGHKSNSNQLDCMDCYAMFLLQKGMLIYRERLFIPKVSAARQLSGPPPTPSPQPQPQPPLT